MKTDLNKNRPEVGPMADQYDRPAPKLYDPEKHTDACGVGFITVKSGKQTHDLMLKGHEALCVVPHRGGMNSEGIGDGAGCCVDLSEKYFGRILGKPQLKRGEFGVANFFFPADDSQHDRTVKLVEDILAKHKLPLWMWREVEVDESAVNEASAKAQLAIHQVIFGRPEGLGDEDPMAFEVEINEALEDLEEVAYSDEALSGFFPCSMSSRTVVYKGRLNSGELVPYFKDLSDADHEISVFTFHTRFSTNTEPATFMAQPFRRLCHNGELNTDKKNRLSEDAIAKQKNRKVIFPKGQSDSARLDQTLTRRVIEDRLDIVEAVLAMMPPAWENDPTVTPEVRAMFEYLSLYEEKNDGPAALVFCDGIKVGARLDRLGLRPLRSIETDEYLAVTSEAGQIEFDPERVIRRGRIESGGMIYFDHGTGKVWTNEEVLKFMAAQKDYAAMLKERLIRLEDLPEITAAEARPDHPLTIDQRHVAYAHNQESFKFLLDPMILTGAERVSAMGYGVATNALTNSEGGMYKYFSQRFAQVTNPPLDSIREQDGMTLRVALGGKPTFAPDDARQVMLESPIVYTHELEQLRRNDQIEVRTIPFFYTPTKDDAENERLIIEAVERVCDEVEKAGSDEVGIIVLSDADVSEENCPLPSLLMVAAANQRLIRTGLRFHSSILLETGQVASSHHIACSLGFGASAICPLTIENRAKNLSKDGNFAAGLEKFRKACHKSLLKTMGKFGLCTVESYIGGEFFEPNCLSTEDPILKKYFPNAYSPIGGAGFEAIASSAREWHERAFAITGENDIPHLGLFKERNEGAGHSFGNVAVREYTNMTNEEIVYAIEEELSWVFERAGQEKRKDIVDELVLLSERAEEEIASGKDITKLIEQIFQKGDLGSEEALIKQSDAVLAKLTRQLQAQMIDKLFGEQNDAETPAIKAALSEMVNDSSDLSNAAYKFFGFEKRTPEQIDRFRITRAYDNFAKNIADARWTKPAALRDILYFPADVTNDQTVEDFDNSLGRQRIRGNNWLMVHGMRSAKAEDGTRRVELTTDSNDDRLLSLHGHLSARFPEAELEQAPEALIVKKSTEVFDKYLDMIVAAPTPLELEEVQPAHEITATLSSAAMSHGALTRVVHEAVSQGANIAGSLSNSGEGGERMYRFNTIKSSSIKQIASGRFGVWAGYFADPNLREVEIKIAQGAKPGEGGQLPAKKVTVEIAASRGGTPGIELVSPPPHHDTYSIEDLSQLIHDAKASRAKVIVKLVSSEGIGTIAVGVAKAGADVINVAGSSGGTGAAQVTSLKNTGRAAEIGIAEVHQALCADGIRQKVVLRASNAHQTGSDVLKSAILGADSFEFGTTALMMLKCVMAKNCNVKCPAGLTTNPEVYAGDTRALAQYFLNVGHDVRRILARLGYRTLKDIRGKTELLQLVEHPNLVGDLDFRGLLSEANEKHVPHPIYREKEYPLDDLMLGPVRDELLAGKVDRLTFEGPEFKLTNCIKSFGGQLSIDVERLLNHQLTPEELASSKVHLTGKKGRRFLRPGTIHIKTTNSAGQSFGAYLVEGLHLEHSGTSNDGVGKGASGGLMAIKSPGGGSLLRGENVLIGNFALFGASGGQLFVNGEAGDRFAVRNSGALGVVEGVGDFCCEYMTSGVVVNLGGCGKGFGNGMSGGNAYQYDADGTFEQRCNRESIVVKRLDEDTDEARAHEKILLTILREHVERTGSELASGILDRWDYEKQFFRFIIPAALFATQTKDGILKAMDRKLMLEELGMEQARNDVAALAAAYESKKPVLDGAAPTQGQVDSSAMFRLVNTYAVMAKAVAVAREAIVRKGHEPGRVRVDHDARELVVNADFKLIESVAKDIKAALNDFSTEELAEKLAAKRIQDYKICMADRDIQEVHSPGASAWIIQQDRANQAAILHQARLEELVAVHTVENHAS